MIRNIIVFRIIFYTLLRRSTVLRIKQTSSCRAVSLSNILSWSGLRVRCENSSLKYESFTPNEKTGSKTAYRLFLA